jgi:hypothetical protein
MFSHLALRRLKHVFDWQYIFQMLLSIFVANLMKFSVTLDYTASKSVLQKHKIL